MEEEQVECGSKLVCFSDSETERLRRNPGTDESRDFFSASGGAPETEAKSFAGAPPRGFGGTSSVPPKTRTSEEPESSFLRL